MNNKLDEVQKLLTGKQIGSISSNHATAIKPEMLSLHRNVLLVNDRIWVPKTLVAQFCTNLHMGHRSQTTMMKLAQRSCYWSGIKNDIVAFFSSCADCNDHMNCNKHPEYFPADEATYPF